MNKITVVLIPVVSMAVLTACASGPTDGEVRAMVQAEVAVASGPSEDEITNVVRAEVARALAELVPDLIGLPKPAGKAESGAKTAEMETIQTSLDGYMAEAGVTSVTAQANTNIFASSIISTFLRDTSTTYCYSWTTAAAVTQSEEKASESCAPALTANEAIAVVQDTLRATRITVMVDGVGRRLPDSISSVGTPRETNCLAVYGGGAVYAGGPWTAEYLGDGRWVVRHRGTAFWWVYESSLAVQTAQASGGC
jgi:hypothetical protein